MEDFDFSELKPTVDIPSSKKEKKTKSSKDTEEGKKKKKSNRESGKSDKKGKFGIWVGNLNFNSTRESIFNHFSSNCGKVVRVNLPMKDLKRSKGYAYIDFESEDSMKAAISLSESELEGRKLLIKDAKDFSTTGNLPRPSKEAGDKSKKPSGDEDPKKPVNTAKDSKVYKKLFVGNLSFEASKENVEKYFSRFGNVEKVRISEFEDTGRCKGFAHVIFESSESAQKAMSSRPLKMDGRILRVEYGQQDEIDFSKVKAKKNVNSKKEPADALALPSGKRQKIKFSDSEEEE